MDGYRIYPDPGKVSWSLVVVSMWLRLGIVGVTAAIVALTELYEGEIGIVAALVLSRVLQSFLFGVNPADPATLLAVGAIFALVAVFACWAPGRRAANVDPLEALRCD